MADISVIVTGNFQGLFGYVITIWTALKLHKACKIIDEEQDSKTGTIINHFSNIGVAL